jgi:RIO kinase 1
MQAIDPRTRMVLFKMLNRGVFNNINGCISTGKEVALRYHIIVHIGMTFYIVYQETK